MSKINLGSYRSIQGKCVSEHQDRLGISTRRLATMVEGITRPGLVRLRSGDGGMRTELLVQLACVFGVTPASLLPDLPGAAAATGPGTLRGALSLLSKAEALAGRQSMPVAAPDWDEFRRQQGAAVGVAIRKAGHTLSSLAERVEGANRGTLSRVVEGKGGLMAWRLWQICRETGATPADILPDVRTHPGPEEVQSSGAAAGLIAQARAIIEACVG